MACTHTSTSKNNSRSAKHPAAWTTVLCSALTTFAIATFNFAAEANNARADAEFFHAFYLKEFDRDRSLKIIRWKSPINYLLVNFDSQQTELVNSVANRLDGISGLTIGSDRERRVNVLLVGAKVIRDELTANRAIYSKFLAPSEDFGKVIGSVPESKKCYARVSRFNDEITGAFVIAQTDHPESKPSLCAIQGLISSIGFNVNVNASIKSILSSKSELDVYEYDINSISLLYDLSKQETLQKLLSKLSKYHWYYKKE